MLVKCISPCHLPSDDMVFTPRSIVVVSDLKEELKSREEPSRNRKCSLSDERLDVSNGRWVRKAFPDNSTCFMKPDTNVQGFKNFIPEYYGNQSISCWHRDDLSQLGNACGEMHCRETIAHRWISDLHKETKWYGMWEPYDCTYYDITDKELQTCVAEKGISSIDVEGASISGILRAYLSQRLQNITLLNETEVLNSTKVTISTLKMPHLLWGKSLQMSRTDLMNKPNISADSNEEHYFITGFFYTSEREPHVQVDRSLLYSQMAYDTLTPKGYKMINAFDNTAAFSYDTGGQFDGLHIMGPPIRSIMTKFFHHLCEVPTSSI